MACEVGDFVSMSSRFFSKWVRWGVGVLSLFIFIDFFHKWEDTRDDEAGPNGQKFGTGPATVEAGRRRGPTEGKQPDGKHSELHCENPWNGMFFKDIQNDFASKLKEDENSNAHPKFRPILVRLKHVEGIKTVDE